MKKLLAFHVYLFFVLQVVYAQSDPDRHSSVTTDAWLSCSTSPNPNGSRGTSHWIRYDLGHTYSIANIDIWNFNHPDSIDMGIRDAVIDVSLDGVTWTSMGQFTVPRANGSTLYAGAKSVHNLGFQPVRYLLITPITNYGGSSCYGFSEIKMHLAGSLLPVTISDIAVNCKNNKPSLTWKSEKEKDIIAYEILGSDNAENWKVYQTVTPKGSGKYAAILDEHTPSYLRIRALEVTNNNTVSDIVLNDCSNGLNVFSASPNPFEQQFSLTHTPSLRSVPQRVLIRDVGGRIVYTQYLSSNSSNNNSYIVTPHNLQSGIYFVEVEMQGDVKNIFRIVKI